MASEKVTPYFGGSSQLKKVVMHQPPWVFPKIGVPWVFPPKWMVKIMENPMNKWMIWGENPTIFGNIPIYKPWKDPLGRGSHNPIVRGRKRLPWLLTTCVCPVMILQVKQVVQTRHKKKNMEAEHPPETSIPHPSLKP